MSQALAPLEIVGAGPAGFSSAFAVRAAGRAALVHEKSDRVGGRFHGDFQGLENWTRAQDVIDELVQRGIQANFDHVPVRELVCFGPDGARCEFRSDQPLYYLVRRGSAPGTLDHGLLQQALSEGVEVRFGSRKRHLPNAGIVAEGPHRADVIAAGYLFQTDMADGCFAAISDDLAPAGYAYLLVNGGRGTVATCLFDDFHREREYLERTVEFFTRWAGMRASEMRRFGGSGNFGPIPQTRRGAILYAGEAAGFQDALFGFGLRYAIVSGFEAGTALANGAAGDYQRRWRARLGGLATAGLANRWLYERLSDRRRFSLMTWLAGRNPRAGLYRIYRPAWWKSALSRLAARVPARSLKPLDETCDCTWCRCRHGVDGALS